MCKTLALIGNPNCGKTTLFNRLTGARQKIGNWSGVTTEKKDGRYLKNKSVRITDLPGLYSLGAKSSDERAVIEFLKTSRPDVIINVVDGTNLERNLYLTFELLELNIPVVLAVTFSDELKKNGMELNEKSLSSALGVPVIQVCAVDGSNLDLLVSVAINRKNNDASLKLSKSVSARYSFAEQTVKKALTKKRTVAERFTERADNVLLHKFWGLPILFLTVVSIYFLSIRVGGYFGEYISRFFNGLAKITEDFFTSANVPEWMNSLISDAIIKGAGLVLSFAPQILVLFALLAVVEESGYAARAAFVIDRLFSSFGLGGKSFIPMILGCGCTVSGFMATRTIENEDEKRATIFLTPFMPCGAKTAVFGWFSSLFFGGSALLATAMYFLGILSVIIGGSLIRKFNGNSADAGSFVMEIPLIRKPKIKDVLIVVVEKIKDYLGKAGLIVFVVSVFLWALRALGPSGYVGCDTENSFLYLIGNKIKFLFYPIGVTDWRVSVALISGIFAKEAVIESIGLLSENPQALFNNAFGVYAFCAFVLLSPPCAASIAQAARELKSAKLLLSMILFQTAFGYSTAIVINLIGNIIYNGLLFSAVVGIIISVSVILAIKTLIKKDPCKRCATCRGVIKCRKKEKRSTI